MSIVVIEPISLSHVDQLHSLLQDETIGLTQQMPTPCSLGWVEDYVGGRVGRMEAGLGATYTIVANNTMVGSIGMAIGRTTAARWGHWGFWIERRFRGNGYATEAGRLVIRRAFGELRLDRIDSDCLVRNIPSMKIHENLGFVETSRHYDRGSNWPNDLFAYSTLKKPEVS